MVMNTTSPNGDNTEVLPYVVLEDCFLVNLVQETRFRSVTVDALWELGIITQRFTSPGNTKRKMPSQYPCIQRLLLMTQIRFNGRRCTREEN